MSRLPRLPLLAATAATAALAALPASAAAALPVPTSFAAAAATAITNPNGTPPGANVPCTPSAAHPRPVVLVHGTGLSPLAAWGGMSPYLANQGFCVYAGRFGYVNGTPGVDEIETAAAQLSDYVDEVLAETGAEQVDLVGQSQGGMMPRHYLKNLGGSAKVASHVALAPTNHGTTLSGLVTLLSLIPGGYGALDLLGPSLRQQTPDAPFIAELNAGDETPGPTRYSVIATKYDEVVTPYRSAYLTGATNINLQYRCPIDFSEHLQLLYSRRALTLTANLLDGGSRRVPCSFVLPFLG